MPPNTPLRKGDWLVTSDNALYEFVSRRRKNPGFVVLKHLGYTHLVSKRNRRPRQEYPESFLELLTKIAP